MLAAQPQTLQRGSLRTSKSNAAPWQPAPSRSCYANIKCHASNISSSQEDEASIAAATRRALLASACATTVALALPQQEAKAVQGLTAGRIPGVTSEPDAEGYYTYTRPEGKSGGHGVGWSEIPRYSFRVPAGWEETPVSIADLGGTEIDLRFGSKDEGNLSVVVAPVLRFTDVGFNADVRIEQLGPPERIIAGFAPELFGKPLDEDGVLETQVVKKDGISYYMWQVKPHNLVAATAMRNRMFLLSIVSNSRQWKKHQDKLRVIQESFLVPEYTVPPMRD